MGLVDGQPIRPPVNLPRAGEDDFRLRVVLAAGFENRQLAAAVDLEVRVRVLHAVDVAHLAGEVEDHIAPLHEIAHRRGLPHVGDVDAQARFEAGDVREVAAVVGNERVDEQDVGAEVDERVRQVRTDEAEATGDEHAAAAIELAVRLGHEGSRFTGTAGAGV